MIKKCPLNDPDIYKRFYGQGGGVTPPTPLEWGTWGTPWPSAMS